MSMEHWPEGISLIPKTKVESDPELLAARNILQIKVAEKLQFLYQNDGATLEIFLEKYAEALGDIFKDNPDFVEEYRKSLEEKKEDTYDFRKILDLLPRYIPAHLNQ